MTQYGTVKDVAAMLKVSPRTVQRWVRRHSLPFFRIGGTIRFDLAAVEARLKERTVRPKT